MSKPSSLRVPSYRRHKPTGQAVVTINGQDIYLGKWNMSASKAEYVRLIAEFLSHGRQLQSDAEKTVVEPFDAYQKFSSQGDPPVRCRGASSRIESRNSINVYSVARSLVLRIH